MQHVFVDFEMTCWDRKDRIAITKASEIIQIGAVRLDEGYNLKDTFSLLVKPQHGTYISKKCTKLTGISYSQLENAPSLDEALILFEDWIGEDETRFYSWSNSDRLQLEKECVQKGLYQKLPKCYLRWRDMQRIFMKVYGFTRAIKLKDAVEILGMDFDGRQHSALDDALNGAMILNLMKDKKRHEAQKKKINDIYFNNKAICASIGELVGDKLKLLALAG